LPDRAETAKEALEISLNVKMKIDLPYMANLTGKTADELIDELGDRIYLIHRNTTATITRLGTE
jgi:N12 class adenine-specific DNA methylase